MGYNARALRLLLALLTVEDGLGSADSTVSVLQIL